MHKNINNTSFFKDHLYLVEFVDVDLSLLVSFCAHVHWSSNQEDVGVGITIHVHRLQDAAKVGTNLKHRGQKSSVSVCNCYSTKYHSSEQHHA